MTAGTAMLLNSQNIINNKINANTSTSKTHALSTITEQNTVVDQYLSNKLKKQESDHYKKGIHAANEELVLKNIVKNTLKSNNGLGNFAGLLNGPTA